MMTGTARAGHNKTSVAWFVDLELTLLLRGVLKVYELGERELSPFSSSPEKSGEPSPQAAFGLRLKGRMARN